MVKQLVPLPPYDEEAGVTRIYGPYYISTRNRYVVHIFYKNGKRINKTYARYRMEKYLGHQLAQNIDVHHKNENRLDDRLENLQVISDKEHASLHKLQFNPKETICLVCGKIFILDGDTQSKMAKGQYVGLYCSKSCASKAKCIKYTNAIRKNTEIRKEKYGY